MINCKIFFDLLAENNIEFFTGVPDSLLKDICAYISDNTTSDKHIIAANEGAALSLATGHYLATGKVPMVYLQNSGLGNIINPLLSIADKEVYGVPMLVMIGWRGEPGKKDEPQHVKQGRVQNALLDAMEVPYKIIDKNSDVPKVLEELVTRSVRQSQPVALVVSADTFESYKLVKDIKTNFELNREGALKEILQKLTSEDVVVSTTGKASREVFELRKSLNQQGNSDFLTVGAMGHANQIALGIALGTTRKVFCLDGDGSVLMHMGSLAIIGQSNAANFIHVVINNGAHDSVGGQPTVAFNIQWIEIAKACGYKQAYSVSSIVEIRNVIDNAIGNDGPIFIEVRVNKGARNELGRPTSSPRENKIKLMETLSNEH